MVDCYAKCLNLWTWRLFLKKNNKIFLKRIGPELITHALDLCFIVQYSRKIIWQFVIEMVQMKKKIIILGVLDAFTSGRDFLMTRAHREKFLAKNILHACILVRFNTKRWKSQSKSKYLKNKSSRCAQWNSRKCLPYCNVKHVKTSIKFKRLEK